MDWIPESAEVLTSTVEAIEGGSRASVLATAIRRATTGRDDFSILVAGCLLEFRTRRYWEPLGYVSFQDFVRAELPFGLRSAQQMMRVYRRLVHTLHIPPEQLRSLGWSKLAVVAGVLTATNVNRVLADVAQFSFARLRELYAPSQQPALPSTPASTPPALIVTPVVAAALARAAALLGDDAPQHGLEHMCLAFLASTPAPTATGAPSSSGA